MKKSLYILYILYIYIYSLKIAKQQQVSIIVLTGDPSENEKSKCLNILEVNEFLVKPVTLYQLNKTFNTIFRREENKREEIEYQEKSIKRVLVIDDDKLLNNLIRQFLDQYEVIQAYSIREVPIYIYIYIWPSK